MSQWLLDAPTKLPEVAEIRSSDSDPGQHISSAPHTVKLFPEPARDHSTVADQKHQQPLNPRGLSSFFESRTGRMAV